jgi:Dual specificity phosphatase, catalytic domain
VWQEHAERRKFHPKETIPLHIWIKKAILERKEEPSDVRRNSAADQRTDASGPCLPSRPFCFSLAGLASVSSDGGGKTTLFPLADFTAPTLEHVEQALAIIDGFLVHGLPVAVHCGAGLGRTGTILACYLVSQGSSAKDASQQVRTRRPGSIETPEQEAVIEAYEQARQDKRR